MRDIITTRASPGASNRRSTWSNSQFEIHKAWRSANPATLSSPPASRLTTRRGCRIA